MRASPPQHPDTSTADITSALAAGHSSRRRFLTVLGATGLAAVAVAKGGALPVSAAGAKPFDIYNVTESPYNAAGDGTTDDTAAIQHALNDAFAAGGGCVFFPAGNYLVKLQTSGSLKYCLMVGANVTLLGASRDATTIKLDRTIGSGYYTSIVVSSTAGTPPAPGLQYDMTGVAIENLTFDAGGSFNTINSTTFSGNAGYNMREIIHIQTGSNVRVENCRFHDIGDSINTATFNGETGAAGSPAVSNLTVRNNVFQGVGTSSTVSHDHSTLYVCATVALLSGNTFASSAAGAQGAVCAIETHSSRTHVVDNDIVNYTCGITTTGVAYTNTEQVEVGNNTIRGVSFGIYILSQQYGVQTGAIGLREAWIHDNQIVVDRDQWWTRYSGFGAQGTVAGVYLSSGNNLPVKDVQIARNHIRFLASTNTFGSNDWQDAGVFWYSPNISDLDVTICDNYVDSAFTFGIYVNGPASRFDVLRNTLYNPGSGAPGNSTLDGYRYAILVSNPSATTLTDTRVNGNRLVDDRATRVVKGTFAITPGGAATKCEALDNTVNISDTTSAELPVFVASSTSTNAVYLRGRCSGWTNGGPSGYFRYGSMVVAEVDGVIKVERTAPSGTGAAWTNL